MNKIKIISIITLITFFSFFNISNAKSEILQVSDALLDIDILKNKEVNISGFFISLGTLAYIYEEAGSMNFIMVETKNAPRDHRKYLLKNCGWLQYNIKWRIVRGFWFNNFKFKWNNQIVIFYL